MKLSFELSEENIFWRDRAKEFAEKVAGPKAAEVDRTAKNDRGVFKAMSLDYGLVGVSFAKEVGGSGGDDLCRSLVIEEVAKQCAATGVNLSVSQLAPYCLLQYGSQKLIDKYAQRMLKGGQPNAFALTEPQAASDAATVEASAELKGDKYIINGSKYFITNGAMSELSVMFARTGGPGVKGISAFVVEKGMPGFTYGRRFDKMGIGGSQAIEQVYKNVEVPKENLLGQEGQGFAIAMTALDAGRIGISSLALGMAERALDESVKRMHERKQFGQPIANFDGMRWYISEMKARIEASRNLIWKTIWLKSTGQDFSLDVAIAKLFATETARICSERAVQIHGAYGYIKDYVVERIYRDAKGAEIYEGTSEIQKLIIARKTIDRAK